jgi:hypothetical protein
VTSEQKHLGNQKIQFHCSILARYCCEKSTSIFLSAGDERDVCSKSYYGGIFSHQLKAFWSNGIISMPFDWDPTLSVSAFLGQGGPSFF